MSKVTTSAPRLISLQTVFIAIATALVVLRLYVRSRIIRNIALDDVFIVFGLAFAIASSVTSGLMFHYDLESSSSNVLPRKHRDTEFGVITEIIVLMSTMLTRISICFFLLRIFGSRKPWRFGLYAILALAVITNINIAILALIRCQPLQSLWNTSVKGACSSANVSVSVALFQGASAVFCDWTLALLPIVFMWDVKIPVKFKATICVLMGMGTFSGICALERSLATGLASKGLTGNVMPIMWMMLEQNIGIIAACIPTLKPLLPNPIHFHWAKGLRRRRAKAVDDNEDHLQNLTYTSKTIAVGIRQSDLDYARASEQIRDEAGQT